MTARLYIGDVFDRMADLEPLDCGHPDDTPDISHDDCDGRQVCAACCPTCNEGAA